MMIIKSDEWSNAYDKLKDKLKEETILFANHIRIPISIVTDSKTIDNSIDAIATTIADFTESVIKTPEYSVPIDKNPFLSHKRTEIRNILEKFWKQEFIGHSHGCAIPNIHPEDYLKMRKNEPLGQYLSPNCSEYTIDDAVKELLQVFLEQERAEKDVFKSDVKNQILRFISERETKAIYPSDISESLKIPFELTIDIIKELITEDKIEIEIVQVKQ